MRTPPLLEHTGTGVLQIVNYNERKEYGVFTPTGTLMPAPIVDGVVQLGGLYGDYKVSYVSAPSKGTTFVRLAITYHTETTTICRDNCGLAYDCVGSPVPNCRPCWGSSDDGNYCCGGICCGGSRGQTCNDVSRQVKNPTPAGFTEQYGEWIRIDNPSVDTLETKELEVITFSPKVEWDEDYYQEVAMPVPHQAQVINEETGEPTGEFLENVPAWDYDAVYFIHYDPYGEVLWMKDYINDPECFTIVEKELMKTYEMWVSNLPPFEEGMFEFVIANADEEFVRLEGNV